jgi:hypothetical protein
VHAQLAARTLQLAHAAQGAQQPLDARLAIEFGGDGDGDVDNVSDIARQLEEKYALR